jgi:hypothetical protein
MFRIREKGRGRREKEDLGLAVICRRRHHHCLQCLSFSDLWLVIIFSPCFSHQLLVLSLFMMDVPRAT